MPYIYDRLIQMQSAWEHETFAGREILYLSDLSVAFKLARWTSAYLQCCDRLGKRTTGGGSPSYYMTELDKRCKALSAKYEKHNNDVISAVEDNRRVCYIYGAQFCTHDAKVYGIDYENHLWFHDNGVLMASRVKYTSDELYGLLDYDVAEFIAFGFRKTDNGWMDPKVCLERLMPVEYFETLRSYYDPAQSGTFDYISMLQEKGLFDVGNCRNICLKCKSDMPSYYSYVQGYDKASVGVDEQFVVFTTIAGKNGVVSNYGNRDYRQYRLPEYNDLFFPVPYTVIDFKTPNATRVEYLKWGDKDKGPIGCILLD